jgi:hypothetical protein
MLAKPEIGTREHILLWLSGKRPDEVFYWHEAADCACGQYAKSFGLEREWMKFLTGLVGRGDYPALSELNELAVMSDETFGDLYKSAEKAWRK